MEGGVAPFSSSMAPSGSYILIIVSQPVNDEHKKIILERLNKGLLSWDVESTGCDLSGLETVCSSISAKHLDDTDVLIQHSTESLGVEVLVSPTVSTLKQCVKNLFSTSTGHKHLVHAGYTFAGTGSWILQNGTFSFDEFLEIFQQADVQSQKRCNIHVHCAELGSWNSASFNKDIFTKVANVSFNPQEKGGPVPGSEHLIGCLVRVLSSQALEEIMEASTLVGNIRFNRPTLYLFPAGQGDCALFGINGFNMLIDGGFNRKPCSWEFIRHLDRLDAVLVTRLCENNVCGMSTLMQRKSLNNTYPQIGYVFCNIGETKVPSQKEEMLKNKDDLVVSVVGEGHNFTQTLNELKLKPHQCWRDSSIEPFVLYHKVGHGTLEMHVLSPPKDSKEMKDFLTEWSSYKETFSCIKSGLKSKSLENAIPLSHATSICAVLIWRPADPKDTITRILFPGSAPQSKIFESLDRLKNLDVLKQPVVTKASLSVAVAKTANNKFEKSVSRASIPNRKNTASPALSVSSVASRNGDVAGVKKEVKKVVKEVKKDNKDVVKKEIKKEVKKDVAVKEVKKTAAAAKSNSIVKKEVVPKEPKKDNKDIKQIIKKDTKELKAVIEKKQDVKTAIKKTDSATTVGKTAEVKKTATTTVRKTTTVAKKEISKTASTAKSGEIKKTTPSKASEPKAAKDVSNKKAAEAKSVAKPKPKSAISTTKSAPKSSPKATSVAPKSGNKVTKAVAASSIVASVVAVTAAAFELNEKQDEIVDAEPDVAVKELELGDETKDLGIAEKSDEMNVSPLPPEALSPTPSESISLTPSDTLSSAPLETVSPTPPLANEPMSVEEKEVNEIKEIEQDPIPYEMETAEEVAKEDVEEQPDEIEKMIAQHQEHADLMSSSFMGSKDLDAHETEEVVVKTEAQSDLFSSKDAQNVDMKNTGEAEFDKIDNDNEDVKDIGYDTYSKQGQDFDDQLAQLSMEGSFCPGMISQQEGKMDIAEVEVTDKVSEVDQLIESDIQQDEQQHQVNMSGSFIETDNYEDKPEETAENISETNFENAEKYSPSHQNSEIISESNFQENQLSAQDLDSEYVADMQEKEVADEKYHEENRFSPEPLEKHAAYQSYAERQEVHSIDQSFANRLAADDYDISRNIIEDSEMQETSVDEPEEIVRKESAVSITLNDENFGADYDDDMRRQSVAESEDDVDIQNYMVNDRKDSFDQDKLNVRRDADSDNEDVVKSPTPHAIVDYEGHTDDVNESDDVIEESEERMASVQEQNSAYLTEKQDFDEKDRDSAEDQEQEDTDDGEMIRHPTPEMKYSEDEMRDPIGQHYITAPGLKSQIVGITDQPLYEEAEDDGSDRSVSPIVDQPVFGNVVEADFPELVTVSGGTTPSEPHSPKAGFDTKKFVSEAAVMDALSEHDCSESSTHSPLCHEENTAFELPVASENVQDLHAERDDTNHEVDSTDLHDNVTHVYEQEKEIADSQNLELEREELRGYEQYSKEVHEDKQENKELHCYEEEIKQLHASEQESNDFHVDRQEDKDVHAYDQDLHAYDQDLHASDRDLHASDQDLHASDQDLHAYEQDSKNLQGYEEQSKDVLKPELNLEKEESTKEESPVGGQQTFHDEKLDLASAGNYDAPSDDESFSQNDKSETKSEKSDVDDEKSDIHQDDRSDTQHDSKSDMMDDDQVERKSDMHEDDRSDSHFDDKQDGYDGKSENAYEVPEDTRSHNYGSEQFRMDDEDKYEMQYDKYEIQEKFQQETTSDNSENKFSNFEIQEKSFEDNTLASQEKEFEAHTDFVGEITKSKLTAPYEFGGSEDASVYIKSEIVSDVDFDTGVLKTQYDSLVKDNEEITDNFNIPSGFQDNANESEKFLSNIPSVNELNEFNISSQRSEDIDNLDPPQQNSESSYDHYENIHTKESYSEFAKDNVDFRSSSYSDYVQEDASMAKQSLVNKFPEELSFDGNKFQELALETDTKSAEHDIISPLHTENLSGIENKVLTEITEAHQYEILSKFEENVHTSNMAYTESTSTKNMVSDDVDQYIGNSQTTVLEDKNFNLVSEETKYFSSANNFENSGIEHDSQHQITDDSYLQMSSSMHAGIVEENVDERAFGNDNTLNFDNQGFVAENAHNLKSDNAEEHLQTRAEVHETGYEYSHGIDPKQVIEGEMENNFDLASQSTTNGKEQTTWSHSVSGYTTRYEAENDPSIIQEHTSYSTHSEQETSYIINSRFHSDSPEDNVMRSDSSPDVPPYPLDSTGQLADLTTAKDDYPGNMNLPKVAKVAPLSPSKTRNANRDSPYGESSEEEDDSSSIPGNVSPYAYTNKAYAKEDEDVDGNHIYKESIEKTTTETIKEFDGNNPQTLNHQVGYEYQETKTEYDVNNQQTVTTHQVGYQEQGYTGETNYDFRLEEWDKPMGLPTPPDSSQKTVAPKKTEKKSLGKSDTNGKTYSPSVSKMSSPMKKPKTTKESSSSPVYVDLAYVPHHGDPQYCDIEFFKKVRARYYVFSGINPSKEVLNALLEAKKGWKEDLEVTIIPTYETDTLGYWMAQNQDDLAEYSIEVAPSASRCTVNLQDHETSCAAYRLEF